MPRQNNRTRLAPDAEGGASSYDGPADIAEAHPVRGGGGEADLLERLRAALRIWSPVLFVRLHTPDGEAPYLHTKRGRKDRVLIIDAATVRYVWADTAEDAGDPDDPDAAAKAVATAMGAPVRTV